MRRRAFITLLATAWPLATRAQQARLPIIGVLGTPAPNSWGSFVAAFEERLRELGWVDGHTVSIQYRWAEGRSERIDEFAAEFVRLNADVIVTAGWAVHALKRATSDIPIVFAVATEPVRGGLVASLRRPGGNVTGLSVQQTDLAGKRIELLREIAPGLHRLAVLANADYFESMLELAEVESIGRSFGLDVSRFVVRSADEIAYGFAALKGRADALYVIVDGLINANRVRINSLALDARLPTVWIAKEYLEGGALLSYGPNFADMFRRAASYVDKILRGAKPADLPIEQPTKFELVVNLKTAKSLSLKISDSMLLRADEIIE